MVNVATGIFSATFYVLVTGMQLSAIAMGLRIAKLVGCQCVVLTKSRGGITGEEPCDSAQIILLLTL